MENSYIDINRKGSGMGQEKKISLMYSQEDLGKKIKEKTLWVQRQLEQAALALTGRKRLSIPLPAAKGCLGQWQRRGRGDPLSPGSCTAPSHLCSQKRLLNSLSFLQLHLSFIYVPFMWTQPAQPEVSWKGVVALCTVLWKTCCSELSEYVAGVDG